MIARDRSCVCVVGKLVVLLSWLTCCSNTHAQSSPDKADASPPGRDAAAWFRSLDKNADGKIEKDEVSDQVWQRVQRSDADGDGQVTLAEIESSKTRDTRPGGVGPTFEVRTFRNPAGDELHYGWLAPLKMQPGERYPLVLCLHGRGGSTQAATALGATAMREKYPCFVFAPECKQPAWWAMTDVLGRGEHAEKLPLVIEALRSLLKSESIDPTRVYVTGQSMGGVGTWAAVTRHAELFAAAIPVCGAWRVEDAPKMKSVPIWAFHGEKDTTVPVKWSRDLTAAVQKIGGNAKYTEYPGVGHGSWSATYADADVWAWLFEQRKRVTPSRQ